MQDAQPPHAVFGIKRAGKRIDHSFDQTPAQALHHHADQKRDIGRDAQRAAPRDDGKAQRHQDSSARQRPAEPDTRQDGADQQKRDGKTQKGRAQRGSQPFASRRRTQGREIFGLHL